MDNHSSEHHSHHKEHKKSDTITIKKPKFIKDIKKNPWIGATLVLALVVIFLLFKPTAIGTGTPAGAAISQDDATQIVLDFASNQGLAAEHVATTLENDLYKVDIVVQGQEVPVYITKDGKNLVPSVIPLDEIPTQAQDDGTGTTATPTEVPQAQKPQVELFVMSHCPYGTQIEKGMLPVVKELGDSIDFEVKFVNYAMHPSAGEVQEQVRQYCIQSEQNGKYLDYLSCFLEDGGTSVQATEATSLACQKQVGIDTAKVESCYVTVDEEYDITTNLEDTSSWLSGQFPKFLTHDDENQAYGVRGSPTLVVNGQQVQSGRDAQSLMNSICAGFTDKPESCNTDMTSFGSPGPGFGFDSQGGAVAAGCAI